MIIMGWNDHLDEEVEARNEVLQHLLDHDELEGAAAGVARLVIDQGLGSLKGRQHDVWEIIEREHLSKECPVCSREVPLSELICLDTNGACGECDHRAGKDD